MVDSAKHESLKEAIVDLLLEAKRAVCLNAYMWPRQLVESVKYLFDTGRTVAVRHFSPFRCLDTSYGRTQKIQ